MSSHPLFGADYKHVKAGGEYILKQLLFWLKGHQFNKKGCKRVSRDFENTIICVMKVGMKYTISKPVKKKVFCLHCQHDFLETTECKIRLDGTYEATRAQEINPRKTLALVDDIMI